MSFRRYEKIHRLGKEETQGILEGPCHIMEKIDGANTQIWLEDGIKRTGSRNNDITGASFNGFNDYVLSHPGIGEIISENPSFRLYGEWLVRHTLAYKETAYKKFYLFDIHDGEKFLDIPTVVEFAKSYNIDCAPYHGLIENPTMDQLNAFVGKSEFADRGEGIVIKNHTFVNSFGEMCYAKIVTESFKEDNGVTFGGNNKHSDTYWEMYVINKYLTLARVKKVMDKMQPKINEKLDMKHIPMICGATYHDLITEEAWEIANKVKTIDFRALERVAFKKAKQIYVDILHDDISVAQL